MKKNILITNDNYQKKLKTIKKIIRFCDKNNTNLNINFDKNIKEEYKINFNNIKTAINIKDINERYNYIYDTVCDFLDSKYIGCNYCDFKDDVCKYFRKIDKTHKMGCCYSNKRGGLCSNLNNGKCTIKSISCKLYACPELRNNNLYFKISDLPLLRYFFNIKQKYYLKQSFFEDKDKVIIKLLENKNIYEIINNKIEIFVTENNKNKILNSIRKIIKYCDNKKCNIKIYSYISDKKLNEELNQIENALNINNKKERYSFIYDIICKDLDKKIKTNYCKFNNDICIRDKEKNNKHKNGCCECKGRGKCKYLINSECTMKTCMACKLFTCKYLRKKGIKHSINDYLLSNFFDEKEKYILESSFWTPKEIVIERLLKKEYVSSFK